jgi:molybdopterin synthase sulfur carrier subunit|tara:strand:- start:192 stop:455 length:264 start_codon:yes stop_codon:yes gene_type:complete
MKLELYGASRDFSKESFIIFNLKEKSTIKELRVAIIKFIETNFKDNESYKKIVNSSAFCSDKDEIVSDNYKISNNERVAIIPPIGGG